VDDGRHEWGAFAECAGERTEWLPSPRRVRVELGGETVADSRRMMLLRQHGFLPVYYFPEQDVRTELLEPSEWTTTSPYKGLASYWHVRAGRRTAESAAWSYLGPKPGSPDTRGYFSFDFHSMGWFEEDEPMLVHARDPYRRVDALPSSRHVEVFVGGEKVADTRRPVLLFETELVPRCYVPLLDTRMDLLVPSSSFSLCPYKGRASYYSVRVGDRLCQDAAWFYPQPLRDIQAAVNMLCFWQEREDTVIVVDGERAEVLPLGQAGDGGELIGGTRRLFFSVPAPASMRGRRPGELQHDFSRPNRRAEGPPDAVIDLTVEAAGGRPFDWYVDPPGHASAEVVRTEDSLRSMFSTPLSAGKNRR
jgi:uncharacterized protein (DUF427 family)